MQKPPTHLVILLHGTKVRSKESRSKVYHRLEEIIKTEYPLADVVIPDMPLGIFSCANPYTIINTQLKKIDNWCENFSRKYGATTPIPPIILIGHSTGALFARKLYVCACGENKDAPFENEIEIKTERPWAKSVQRIILFAGMNRGWSLNHHLNIGMTIAFHLLVIIGRVFTLFGKTPVGFLTKRGASFVTQLRLQWLAMMQHSGQKNTGNALVIQLLGTADDLISPHDNLDLVTGSQFIYLDIPNSNHMNVLIMDATPEGLKRLSVFKSALLKNREELSKIQIMPDDENNILIDYTVTDVVFVIHGIRDTGYWTQKIARRVKSIGDKSFDQNGRQRNLPWKPPLTAISRCCLF